jgi:tetratricopeptide (TPR) repeat protein
MTPLVQAEQRSPGLAPFNKKFYRQLVVFAALCLPSLWMTPAHAPVVGEQPPSLGAGAEVPPVELEDGKEKIRAPSEQSRELLRRGATALEAKKYEEAVSAFTALLRAPDLPAEDKGGILALRGSAYQKLGLGTHAVADYTSALVLKGLPEKGRIPVYFNRSIAFDSLGMTDRAMTDLNETLKRAPNHTPALNNRANLNRRLKKYDAALADYQAAINLNYSDAYLSYFGQGLTYEEMGNKTEALKSFVAGFELKPDFIPLRQKLADYGAVDGKARGAHEPPSKKGEGVSLSKPQTALPAAESQTKTTPPANATKADTAADAKAKALHKDTVEDVRKDVVQVKENAAINPSGKSTSTVEQPQPQLRLARADENTAPRSILPPPAQQAARAETQNPDLRTAALIAGPEKKTASDARAGSDGGAADMSSAAKIQFAAYRSESEAQAGWEKLRARHGKKLSGLNPIIERADLGEKGIFYRLKAGPLANPGAAAALCAEFKALGQDCVASGS